MRLFLDTNVVLDHVLGREPFAADAAKLMVLMRLGEFEGWCGASQYTDLFYILTKGPGRVPPEAAKKVIRDLRGIVRTCSLSDEDAESALASTWDDFEDGCIYQMALKVRADAIITRNQADFAKSSIRVFDCTELFDYLTATQGITYEEIEL